MRQLLCVGIFASPLPGVFTHSRLSIGLSAHVGEAGKYFYYVTLDEMMPSTNRLNRFLLAHDKKDVTSYTTTPLSWYEDKVGMNFWQILSSDGTGARLRRFSKGLSMFAALHPVVAMFPFAEALAQGNSASRPLIVDIGGGRGLALLQLKEGCPELKGEFFLQDRAVVLDDISEKELPGVTKMAHDFFTEQPVHNAQVYYIRRVMHDWQDEDAARIMKNCVPAMASDSRLLISDFCLPDPVGLQDAGAIWMDLMMLTIGGKERTARDWEVLAELSGLKLVKIWQEPEKFGPLCVVEYVLKDEEVLTTGNSTEGDEVKANGVALFDGSKSEVALAENVRSPTDGANGEAGKLTERKGVDTEAKGCSQDEELSKTESHHPMELLTGDMNNAGIEEGMPVVDHGTEMMA